MSDAALTVREALDVAIDALTHMQRVHGVEGCYGQQNREWVWNGKPLIATLREARDRPCPDQT